MRSFNLCFMVRLAAAVSAVALLSACCGSAKVDGVLADAPSSELVVKLLDINRYEVLDTLEVGKDGRFSCRIPVEKGQPEFIYLFYKDTKVSSLLLDRGDRVHVEADTTGSYVVTGSEECERLASVEKELAGRRVFLFGSYGWGDGQWMRDWQDRCLADGALLAAEPVIANEAPDEEAAVQLKEAALRLIS